MNNRILLINPWITDFAAYDFWLRPLGLLYVAGMLRKYSYDVALIDCMDRHDSDLLRYQGISQPLNKYYTTGKFYREVIPKPQVYQNVPRNYARYGLPFNLFRKKLIESRKPAVVLMTSGMTYWYPGVQLAVREIRNVYADAPIVLGGIYPTLCKEHAINTSGVDYVISGEGELAALKMVDSLTHHKRSYDEFSSDLDELPFPAYDLYENLNFAAILTSRGCPLKCTFCASNLVAGAYRWRSPTCVVDELRFLHSQLQIDEFAFYDDALLTNFKNHLALILDSVIEQNWRIHFHTPNGLQSRLITSEVAEKMFKSGFKTLRLSYESGNPHRQIDICNKVNDETFVQAVQNLYDAGYRHGELDAYVIMALPGQSIEEILWSMAFVHRYGVKIRLAAFSPIPGTVEWQRAVSIYGFPADADPLLSNNSILPIKARGATFRTFEKISQMAQNLNINLAKCMIEKDTRSLVRMMKNQFSRLELTGVESPVVKDELKPQVTLE
ncbi:MAG: B12-binding domain-containing radical SAM protein [bacterium]